MENGLAAMGITRTSLPARSNQYADEIWKLKPLEVQQL